MPHPYVILSHNRSIINKVRDPMRHLEQIYTQDHGWRKSLINAAVFQRNDNRPNTDWELHANTRQLFTLTMGMLETYHLIKVKDSK